MAYDTPKPLVLSNARVIDPARGLDAPGSVIIADGTILAAGPEAANQGSPYGAEIIDCKGAIACPGLIDFCVSVGEPGAEHRETLASASQAAASGGVTTICTMPDTDPVIDDPALVDFILRRARDTAIVNVLPLAALTKGLKGEEMAEIGLLKEAGAVAFTNGHKSVKNAQVMRRMMTYARDFDALVIHHTEDPDLAGGVMNAGLNASWKGLSGVPREAEIIMLERDLRLVAMSKGKYHANLISTSDSADVVRAGKAKGLDITAGVSINHLTHNENDIGAYRTFFKMSPPLRDEDDRQAMIAAVADGTIDIICSNHDPQDVETKRHPWAEAEDGAIGLETLLAAALRLYHSEQVDLVTLLGAMTCRPADRLGLETGRLSKGAPADVTVFDPERPWVLEKSAIKSRSKNSPFEDARFSGRVLRTVVGGKTVFSHT
ncbi:MULTISPECIES: dihydroorotase [Stappiaceae]|uniref:Dihydroorotase n=1 Tax=Roseibium aggregatum TaxID=187304 RepID=A0A0M6XX38_9HYPH|nr:MULTISPECIES: dihydroorotase [Stappiaceae]QFT00305.1 Dihydroorotase [Labrenzia sp. THAF191b]QFT06618.1 Dihydroorotase [Labrenzia sp. THAF191a]QFT18162.1 Dihydroorotase [Labrenzia sp. THAF187b]CTQ41872.1 Dihydroorotase [Roseibium aggregatum]